MVQLDIDVSGIIDVSETIEDLKPQVGETEVWRVKVGAPYGIYLERGTRHHPPYPFFKPAIRQFQATPRTFVFKNLGRDINRMDDVSDVVEAVAEALALQMRINVAAQRLSGRSPGTHPAHPQIRTGQLQDSISATRIQ